MVRNCTSFCSFLRCDIFIKLAISIFNQMVIPLHSERISHLLVPSRPASIQRTHYFTIETVRRSCILWSVALIGATMAAKHDIQVGIDRLSYTPNVMTVAVGDTVVFHFYPGKHNVGQGGYNSWLFNPNPYLYEICFCLERYVFRLQNSISKLGWYH
jgi:hypothetical protein